MNDLFLTFYLKVNIEYFGRACGPPSITIRGLFDDINTLEPFKKPNDEVYDCTLDDKKYYILTSNIVDCSSAETDVSFILFNKPYNFEDEETSGYYSTTLKFYINTLYNIDIECQNYF